MYHEVSTIYVEGHVQIIEARAQVRMLARTLGFDTMSQARISLATSSLAEIMRLSGFCAGTISFGKTNGAGRATGLYVMCVGHYDGSACSTDTTALSELEKLRGMVDELRVEKLPSKELKVLMVKRLV